MKVFFCTVILSLLLMGCNDNEPTSLGLPKQGIYTNDVDNTLMFVDTRRQEEPIILSNMSNNDFYLIERGKNYSDRFVGKGLYQMSGNRLVPSYKPQTSIETRFKDNDVIVAGKDNVGSLVTYDLTKNNSRLSASDILGKSLVVDSTHWDSDLNGNFTITEANGCITNGRLSESDNGYYLNAVNVSVENCIDTDFNAMNYEVIIFPVTLRHVDWFYYIAIAKNPDRSDESGKVDTLLFNEFPKLQN